MGKYSSIMKIKKWGSSTMKAGSKDYQPWRLKKDSPTMKIGNKRPSTMKVGKIFVNHEGRKTFINHEGRKKGHQPWRLETKVINHEGWKKIHQLWRLETKDYQIMKTGKKILSKLNFKRCQAGWILEVSTK